MECADLIVGWRALSSLAGVSPAVLQMRAHRGKLPLKLHWSEGRRAFDVAEVRTWLERGNQTQKPN